MGRVLYLLTGQDWRAATTVEPFSQTRSKTSQASMKHCWKSPSLCSRPSHRTVLAICSFLLLFLAGTASALDPHRQISQYAHTVWRVQDGFPHGPHMITQTSYGYVWIAVNGLLRFDGLTMTPVLPQNSFPTE